MWRNWIVDLREHPHLIEFQEKEGIVQILNKFRVTIFRLLFEILINYWFATDYIHDWTLGFIFSIKTARFSAWNFMHHRRIAGRLIIFEIAYIDKKSKNWFRIISGGFQ